MTPIRWPCSSTARALSLGSLDIVVLPGAFYFTAIEWTLAILGLFRALRMQVARTSTCTAGTSALGTISSKYLRKEWPCPEGYVVSPRWNPELLPN
jgi:hypothetical protein